MSKITCNDYLDFYSLRLANSERLPKFKNSHGETVHQNNDGSDWIPSQWLQAVCGELGEYANIRKKFERGDIDKDTFQKMAADELADVIIYLDILAKQLGIDLSQAIISKFNEVSKRVNCDTFLEVKSTATGWYD